MNGQADERCEAREYYSDGSQRQCNSIYLHTMPSGARLCHRHFQARVLPACDWMLSSAQGAVNTRCGNPAEITLRSGTHLCAVHHREWQLTGMPTSPRPAPAPDTSWTEPF